MNQDALKDVCLRYLDRDLSDQELSAFSRLIAESEEAARMLARLSINDSHFEFTTTFAINRMTELRRHDHLINDLLRMEEQASADSVSMLGLTGQASSDDASAKQASSVLRVLSPDVVKSIPQQWLAVAAVLLLGVALFIALSGSGDDKRAELADASEAGRSQAGLSPVVATLIAEYDAAWDRRPSENLYAGQRFTLTQGFAEIQTSRGAVAILEAPATIELIDSPNAIRLNAGKLIGVCETESSKGFLVRTPHMDITDLGTRFGVDATQSDATSVHVLEGEVEVVGMAAADGQAQPQQLQTGQALRGDPVVGVTSIDFEALPFAQGVQHFSYRPEVEGGEVVWRGQASGDLSLDARQADAMQMFIERKDVRLQRDTAVDFADSRAWTRGSVPGQQIVSEGKRVDVYLLHLDPRGREGVNGEYTVRFGRPILGVIAHESTLKATDAALGAAGTMYPAFTGKRPISDGVLVDVQRGLDIALNERASLTDDASTLQLNLGAVEFADQIRVLVQAMEEQN